ALEQRSRVGANVDQLLRMRWAEPKCQNTGEVDRRAGDGVVKVMMVLTSRKLLLCRHFFNPLPLRHDGALEPSEQSLQFRQVHRLDEVKVHTRLPRAIARLFVSISRNSNEKRYF